MHYRTYLRTFAVLAAALTIFVYPQLHAQRAGSRLSETAQANVRLVVENLRAMVRALRPALAGTKWAPEVEKYDAVADNIENKLRDGSLRGLRGLQDEPPKKYSHGETAESGEKNSPLGCYCDDITWIFDEASGQWVQCTPGDIIIDESILDPTPGTAIDESTDEGLILKLTLLDVLVHEKGHERMEEEQLKLIKKKLEQLEREEREVERKIRELEEMREKEEEKGEEKEPDDSLHDDELDRMEEELQEMESELDRLDSELEELDREKFRRRDVQNRDGRSDIDKALEAQRKRLEAIRKQKEELKKSARRKATGKHEHGQVYEFQKNVVRLWVIWFEKQIDDQKAALKKEQKRLKDEEDERKKEEKRKAKERKTRQRKELLEAPRDKKDEVKERHRKENEEAERQDREAREAYKRALEEAENRTDAEIARLKRMIKWMKARIAELERGMKNATKGTDFGFHRCGWPGVGKGDGTLAMYVRTDGGYWRQDIDVRKGRAADLRLPETLYLGTLHEEEPVGRRPTHYVIIPEITYTSMQVQPEPCELMNEAIEKNEIRVLRKEPSREYFR